MNKFYIGQEQTAQKVFTEEDVRSFAQISGDDNPLHTDREYAQKSRFGAPVVHGILTAGLISGILGTKLPGPGSIYLEQQLSFLQPVFVGDTVTAKVRITDIIAEKSIIVLETTVSRQSGECVVSGIAKILYEGGAI